MVSVTNQRAETSFISDFLHQREGVTGVAGRRGRGFRRRGGRGGRSCLSGGSSTTLEAIVTFPFIRCSSSKGFSYHEDAVGGISSVGSTVESIGLTLSGILTAAEL